MAKKAKMKKSAQVLPATSVAVQAAPPMIVLGAQGPTNPVAIVDSNEKWSEFILADGTKLRVRPYLNDVRHEPGRWNEATGEPTYHMGIRLDIRVIAPKKLLKPGISKQSGSGRRRS
jgi:hypothetical protein